MGKKKIVVLGVVGLLVVLAVAIYLNQRSEPDPYAQAAEKIYRVENALKEQGEGWERQSITVVTPYTYADSEGNAIVYYCCQTAYFEDDPDEIAGLNTDVLAQVIDLENAKNKRECEVNGKAAILCEVNGRTNLCWTIDPECSCVIEYNPSSISDTDIFRMAESVQAVPAKE